MSGITWFITQQARYQHFANVYAAIMMIGIIGVGSDMLLGSPGAGCFRGTAPSSSRNSMNQFLPAHVPFSYREQSTEVRARFERMKARETILVVRHLDKVFRPREKETLALSGRQLHHASREFLSIVGPSGCGNHSHRNSRGLEGADLGRFLLDGHPVCGAPQRPRHGVPELHAVPLVDGQEER
jgi:hypothetical protein